MSDFDPVDVRFLINRDEVRQDSEAVKRDIIGVDQTAEKSAKRVSQTVQRVYDQNVKEVNAYTAAVNASTAATTRQGKAVASTRPQWNGLNNSINQLSRELPAFTVSAQTGILALSNNIPILADEIRNLKVQNAALAAQGQATIPVWKRIAGALLSWQTLLSVGITLLTVYGREIGAFVTKLVKGKDSLDAVKVSQEQLNKAMTSSEYQKGLQNVLELRNNFDLVKEGAIEGDRVLKQYNDTLGKVVGEASDLNQAEQLFIKNSDNYVQALLYRQAASLTAQETAQKLVEFRTKEIQLEEDYEKQLASSVALRNRLDGGIGGANADQLRRSASERVSTASQRLEKLRKERDEFVKSRNQIFKEFKRQEVSFGFLFGEDAASGSGGDNAILRRRQALLDQLTAIDKEYARKNLDSDAAELQALKDKFAKIRTLITRFNNDPKMKAAQINLSQIDLLEDKATQELLDRQATTKREKEQKAFGDQLKELMSYNQARLALIAEYEQLKQKLIDGGYQEELAVLDTKHQQELAALDDAQVKKLASYQALNDGIDRMATESARIVINNAKQLLKDLLESGKASEDLIKEIMDKIYALEEDLSDRSARSAEAREQDLRKIARSLNILGQSLSDLGDQVNSKGVSQAGAALSGLAEGVEGLLVIFSENATQGDIISAGINGLVNLIDMLAQAANQRRAAEEDYYRSVIGLQNEYNLSLQDQIRMQSILEESVFLTDYEGRIRDASEALNNANEQYQAALADLARASVISGTENKVNLGNVGKGAGSGALVGAAVGSVVPVIGTAIGAVVGAVAGALTGLFAGMTSENTYLPILEAYPDLVRQTEEGLTEVNRELAQSLINNGLVNQETRQILENLLAWQDAIDAAREQINDVISDLAGQLGADLRESLVQAFEQGEDAAKAMGDTVEEVLENILSNLIFNQIFANAFTQLQDEMARSFDPGGDGNWVDDFARFFEQARGLTDSFNQALTDAQREAAGFGFDIFDPDNNSGLKGAIQRELTEATASELTGLYRATFDISKQQLTLSQEWYEKETLVSEELLRTNQQIEINTAETVTQLKQVVLELGKIKKNTDQKNTAYDRGF